MLTVADIVPGTAAARMRAALHDQAAGEQNKGLWKEHHADVLGIEHKTFDDYYLGRSPGTPDVLLRMVAHFGPAFLSAYMAPLRIVCAPEANPPTMARMAEELREVLALLQQMALRTGNRSCAPGRVVPMKPEGKIS